MVNLWIPKIKSCAAEYRKEKAARTAKKKPIRVKYKPKPRAGLKRDAKGRFTK